MAGNRKLGYQFHRQLPADQFIIDFYCHELMITVEIDGSSHNHPYQVAKDKERQFILEQLGVRFIRVRDIDVKQNLNGIVNYMNRK